MKMTLEKTALDFLGLPSASRALLAEKLLASLEDDEPSGETERAWKKEAMKRYRAFKSGKTVVRPHAEVMREAYRLVSAPSK
jgi:hypothetical protein